MTGYALCDMLPISELCNIQEDRDKVEQFHNLWNNVPIVLNNSSKSETGAESWLTIPQTLEQRPKNLEQIQ